MLHQQTTRFPNTADERDALDSTCAVLSTDPSGTHVLGQAFSFGRIDNGIFTTVPGVSPGVLSVAAAWLFAGGTVDALAQQVGVAHVAGVFLDHVQVDQPQRHDLAAVGELLVQ